MAAKSRKGVVGNTGRNIPRKPNATKTVPLAISRILIRAFIASPSATDGCYSGGANRSSDNLAYQLFILRFSTCADLLRRPPNGVAQRQRRDDKTPSPSLNSASTRRITSAAQPLSAAAGCWAQARRSKTPRPTRTLFSLLARSER